MSMEKTFNAAEAEARIATLWEEAGAFRAGANAKAGAPAFCVMIPPPNVTGSLHMGHAFNNTLQDILVRWHRQRGHDVLWQPGTDHAGIATQMVTERELAKAGEPGRREMGREAFTLRVWEQKKKSRGTIIGQLKRLGASCDWSREAFTMSGAPNAPAGEEGNFHDAVIKVFVDLYNKGVIYRGQRLVNWDPHFETAISDLEVENTEVAGHMWHFKYPLAGGATYEYIERDEDGRITLREIRNYISIATTRPETMLGDGAVAVHPSDERYKPIVGMLCEIPVGPKEHRRLIPIITDEYPDPKFGSGAVKITGAHDFNDYAVAQRNGIPLYNLMDTKARMRSDGLSYEESATIAGAIARGERAAGDVTQVNLVPEELRGLDRYEARKAVVAAINAEGLAVTRLVKSMDPETHAEHLELVPLVEDKPIMQPFGDRSKVVIEPFLTWQWFVDAAKIVGPALDAVKGGTVRILPESGEKTYYHWLENIEPWCISRQLWWGHQIPVWYGPTVTKNGGISFQKRVMICAANASEALSIAEEKYGVKFEEVSDENAWMERIAEIANGKIDVVPLYRDPDVLDTWFSSGLWPIGTLGWPDNTPELQRYFPTSVLITGSDILFFWVARMMMMQLAVTGQVPFHDVYLHGLVRDAKGKKMSKSLGNVIDPLEIIDEYGADALRFTNAAMASLGGVLKLDTQRIAGYRNFGTKLWNATRFAEMNGVLDLPPQATPPQANATANRWILGETARARIAVDEALANYRFNDAAQTLYSFVWGKVCDWYVEFAKPLFDGEQAAETRATMRWVLDQCLILLHPFMPFITEDLWGQTGPRDKLCVHADWPVYGLEIADAQADREMGWVLSLIEGVRSSRAQMRVPVGLKLPMLAMDQDAAAAEAYARNAMLIERLARIDGLHPATTRPKAALTVTVEGATYALPIEGVIDVRAEAERLKKALEKLDKDIAGLNGRLNNPRFVASAAEEVVDEARGQLAEKADEAARLREVLRLVSGMI